MSLWNPEVHSICVSSWR